MTWPGMGLQCWHNLYYCSFKKIILNFNRPLLTIYMTTKQLYRYLGMGMGLKLSIMSKTLCDNMGITHECKRKTT